MREKSQLEDMRAAVRGDLERARARREADPWRAQPAEIPADEPIPAESSDRLEPVTPGEAGGEAPAVEQVPQDPVTVAAQPPAPEPAAQHEEPRPGFFARLFRRG
jgi:hypothetical protein